MRSTARVSRSWNRRSRSPSGLSSNRRSAAIAAARASSRVRWCRSRDTSGSAASSMISRSTSRARSSVSGIAWPEWPSAIPGGSGPVRAARAGSPGGSPSRGRATAASRRASRHSRRDRTSSSIGPPRGPANGSGHSRSSTKQAARIARTSASSSMSSGRLPSRRTALTASAGDQARPASMTRRSPAQRSSSQRQPSAVPSRRLISRAGSSGSSGPAGGTVASVLAAGESAHRRRPNSRTAADRACSASSGSLAIRSARHAAQMRSARSSRQDASTAFRTIASSKGLHGWRLAVQDASRRSNSPASSPGRMSVRPVIPCVTAFRHECNFPVDERGPVDRIELRRLASSFRGLTIAGIPSRGRSRRGCVASSKPGQPASPHRDIATRLPLQALLYRMLAGLLAPTIGIFFAIQDVGRSHRGAEGRR
jgi:hypothetical protein